jgi:hypothetical protein
MWKRTNYYRVSLFARLTMIAVLMCCATVSAQWEHRGDLNLNGLPFELVDAAIFADYFASGIGAFAIDTAAQIAATDINMDGICLSVADYVMMIRIEIGAGDPPPADPGTFATNIIYQYTDTGLTILTRFTRIPASMYLEFDFSAPPVYTARLLQGGGTLTMGTAEAGAVATMLTTGMNDLPVGSYLPLIEMTYQGDDPTLIRGGVLGAAGDEGVFIPDTTYQAGDANGDGKLTVGDAVYIVAWIFRGGPMPPHQTAADANCDGAFNVGDAVYIVNYIFRGGKAPCGETVGELISHSNCLSGQEKDGTQDCLEYQYDGQGTLLLTHRNAGLNCCPGNFPATVTVGEGVITIDETPIPGNCECLCLFDLGYQVVNLPAGTYQVVVREQCLSGEDAPLQFTVDLGAAPSDSFCLERTHYPW